MDNNPTNQPPQVQASPIPPPDDPTNLPTLCRFDGLIDQLGAYAHTRFEARNRGLNFGPVTPFPKLTQQFGGAIPNGLHILMGGSGVGKTALALQIASECECPSLYLTCEMTALELLRRSAARVTRTYLGKFKDGTLTGAIVKEKARKAAEGSPDLAIADATKALASDQWIHTVAKAHKAGSPHYLVVIDSLHSWAEGITTGQQDYELISAACRSLRILAANLECPVIAIAEKNRASMGKSTSKEVVSAGAGSRKIEYGSESVIHLEAKAFDKATGETPIKLMFAKNRNGAAGEDIDLIFEGGFQNYREA